MNKEYPKITVIIPQKDRSEFLYHTLRTCMIQDYPNFEVIVSDDNSSDDSVEMVRRLAEQDGRIKLFAHEKHLGMRDNFEFALNQVDSGYVIALGGDDGLVAGGVWKMYNILKETGKQLLTWPMSGFGYSEIEGGPNIFYIKRNSGAEVSIKKSSTFLNSVARTFNYMVDDCPMFYVKGVASVDLVKRVKSRTADGCFYYCPTPDGFSGVVLAGEVEDYAFSAMPLSISGSTHKSQGQNYKRTDEKSRFESEQFFNDNIRRTMHKELASQPYSPLITLMTADYLLTARDLPGWPGRFEMFSYESLLKKTFEFIGRGMFHNDVLARELKILREIAHMHGLDKLYDDLYKTTKIRRVKKETNPCFAFTHSVRFNGAEVGIHNIFDAAIASPFVYHFFHNLRPSDFLKAGRNTLSIFLDSRSCTREPLTNITIE